MTPNEYQQLALRTEYTPTFTHTNRLDPVPHDTKISRLIHGMIGMATKTGELQDAIKKHIFYVRELDLTNVMEEIGDLAWYCALVLDAAGFTFEEALERNIAKLKSRYPNKFTAERANQRDLNAERDALEK